MLLHYRSNFRGEFRDYRNLFKIDKIEFTDRRRIFDFNSLFRILIFFFIGVVNQIDSIIGFPIYAGLFLKRLIFKTTTIKTIIWI